jgi:Mg2+/Co2+ transporter CorB
LEYVEDTTAWEDELHKYNNRCQTQQLIIYEADVIKKIIETLYVIEPLLGRSAIKMCFYNCRREKEDNAPIVHYMSGEEEARECNRQFRSMMDDNDAWGNID